MCAVWYLSVVFAVSGDRYVVFYDLIFDILKRLQSMYCSKDCTSSNTAVRRRRGRRGGILNGGGGGEVKKRNMTISFKVRLCVA